MSRTIRIYNTKKYRMLAIRHYMAKYDNRMYYLWSMHGVSVKGALEQRITIWAGCYFYHPYKQLGTLAVDEKEENTSRRKRERQKNKLLEKNIKKRLNIT